MNIRGLTLIELAVVIAIVGILVVVTGFQFIGWQSRYKVESQIKEMYADLMEARQKAMQKNIPYLNELAANAYTICEDSNGNGVCDTPAETTNSSIAQSLSKDDLKYPLNWGLAGGGNRLTMNRRGITTPNGSIWLLKPDLTTYSDKEVDYDCIVVSSTRINTGKYDGATCQAK